MQKKYKIKLSDLEQQGGVERLKRDGFNREDISKSLYKLTEGAEQRYRETIMSRLHEKDR